MITNAKSMGSAKTLNLTKRQNVKSSANYALYSRTKQRMSRIAWPFKVVRA